ncbi:MAGUK p55 subfamily member 2-like isoform X2 [Phyllopteryx taeniolatus]|uniref:MAGUK p55 subfamily member 2-like isoform X2 n=1 Tax=Phyllopteryx taeniolatus TaxID=161469 RepID=UPI002AD55186|nr:MAGUK p55 subfamily member 2-like isoform X2 [Phyllopteryx taeniolatus]
MYLSTSSPLDSNSEGGADAAREREKEREGDRERERDPSGFRLLSSSLGPAVTHRASTIVSRVLEAMSDNTTSSTTANDLDLIYLKCIMASPLEPVEGLKELHLSPVGENNVELLQEILRDLDPFTHRSKSAAELFHLLTQPHFQGDGSPLSCPCKFTTHDQDQDRQMNNFRPPPDAIRMVGIRKVAGEHLGVTFKVEDGELVIARILHGGLIDQQGLLHIGDIIKEVNGRDMGRDPRVLQKELQAASGSVVLKILPSYHETITPRQMFFKCHYDYNPVSDNLIPCKEAGLRFKAGDILQIVNQDDVNWWQACHVEGGTAGLIPSQMLEEKRKAFVKRDMELVPPGNLCTGVGVKRKKKMMYVTTKNADFDRHEILLYEEVAKVPPFKRKTLILVGAQGVGRRRLKNMLLLKDPHLFGTTIPYTSRKPKKGECDSRIYAFTSRSKMEADIKKGLYLEFGEYDGNLYGIKTDSIHEVVEAGRICILDAHPQSLKVLRTSEFLPYVVFLQSPDFEALKTMNNSTAEAGVSTKALSDEELQKTCEESDQIAAAYGHYFDLSILNNNQEETYYEVKAALETVSKNHQWVPVTWVF